MSKLTLTEIWIYPIKSLPGVGVKSGTVKPKGMEGDRRFMLIDENNRFITQRQLPRLSQFNLSLDIETIRVSDKKNLSDFISIPRQVENNNKIKATIWDDTVDVVEVKSEISDWFSNALAMTCKLVHFPEPNSRSLNPKYVPGESHVSLADGYPYLIIGKNSLRDLNKRIGHEISMKRFRPNLVFDGGEAYMEDNWKDFSIGTVDFSGVKLCDRCVLTTIDPETGEKGDEPLRTLSTYRKWDNKIYFGQNVIANRNGEIKEGEEIILR